MALPIGYQRIIESYIPVAVKPYLQPMTVPGTSRSYISTGFLMNGPILYGATMTPYFVAPRDPWSIQAPLTAPVYFGSNRVFSGQSPSRGIYTGVK